MLTVDPYATEVLRPEVHNRLVADVERIAADANIEPHWIWTSLTDSVTKAEFEWVRRVKHHREKGLYGLALTGKPQTDPTTRFSAMAGALTRNFIRARVMSVGSVIDAFEKGNFDQPTVLFIPNFFLGKHQGSSLPAWKLAHLIDLLVERRLTGLQTVLYISDLATMSEEYGVGFTQHVKAYFVIESA